MAFLTVNITQNTFTVTNNEVADMLGWFNFDNKDLFKHLVAPLSLVSDITAAITQNASLETEITLDSVTLNTFMPDQQPYVYELNFMNEKLQLVNRLRTKNGLFSKDGE